MTRTAGLRLRLTVAGTLLAAGAFAAGGLALLSVYRQSLTSDEERPLRAIADQVLAGAGRPDLPVPVPMPVATGVPRLQVLDAADRVVTGDPVSVGQPPMLTVPPDRTSRSGVVTDPAFVPAHRVYVVAVAGTTPLGRRTVVIAGSLDLADARARRATLLAGYAGGGSIAVVAVLTWLLTGRALRPVEQLLRALESADRRQRQFIADAAHELRTPLAGITAFLEVAARHPETVDRDDLVRRLLAAHQGFGELVDDLLALAAIDAGAPRRWRPVDLTEVVRDCTAHLAAAPVTTNLPGPVVVPGDPTQLRRVVANLLDNAVRHASHAVRVDVSTSAGRAVLTVADDGPGVPAGRHEEIWGRFVRLDDDRGRPHGGTGLGLALVREIVTVHGGTATVRDGEPGAVFTVTLPLYGFFSQVPAP